MRKLIAFFVLLALFCTSAINIFAQDATQEAGVAPERPDLITLLKNDADGRFTTLVAAIEASGAEKLLGDAGPFTLLAPTNDAFDALFAQTGMTADQLLADRATLTKVLLYHVIPGQYFFRNLTSGPELATSLLGQSVKFDLTKGVFTVNGANISDPDNLASNGVMIAIDSVILPPDVAAALATPEPTPEATEAMMEAMTPEMTEVMTEAPTATPTPEVTAAPTATPEAGVAAARPDLISLLKDDPDGRFTTLLAAIDAAGVADSLNGGPFTLLAPTNDAFDALLTQTGMTADQLLADKATLTKVLLQHVIPGKYFFRNLTSGPTLPTLLTGSPVTFDLTQGVFTVNGANISDPDNLASNGVMIAIDSVILPPDVAAALATPEPTAEPTEVVTPEATVEAGVAAERPDLMTLLQDDPDGRFTTLVAAIQASGAEKLLGDAGPFTLLAPTNDAFDALFAQTGMTADQLLADRATLTKVLLYHIIPGQYFFRNLTSGPELPTSLLGQSVKFDLTKGVFTVNGANISDPDNLASNGVMIAIDSVILPPDVAAALATPEATAEPTAEPTAEVTPEATPVASGAHVRFLNFSPNASSVDVTMGAGGAQANLLFGNVSAWKDVAAGSYDVSATANGSGSTASASVTLSADEWVTLAVTGSASTGKLLVTPLVENFGALAADSARLSVFNGVEGSSSYDVQLDGNSLVILLGYPGTQGANDGFYTVDVPAGTYTIQFVIHNNPSNIVINLPDVALAAGTNYFVGAAGASSAPGAVVVASPLP
ncbi:MAG: DUF4397 domain-containing protein [Chloroflexi bacterium]|nr:DUF4397 domain-containing protein [Chloroflexota bacterium]